MDSAIRILHIAVNMNRGGAETLIMNLYRNIDRSKVQFDFLTCRKGLFDSEILELGGRIFRIPYITEVGHLGYLKALKDFFTKHSEYIIVHSHLDKMSGIVLKEAKKAGIPVRIAHSHNTQSEGSFLIKLYKWYAGLFINSSATNFMSCSSMASRWLFKSKASQAEIIKNGVECDKFAFSHEAREAVRKELSISESTLVVGHVGRFNKQKNHDFLIDIFYEANKKNPNSILVLAGDGELRRYIEQKAYKLGLENKVRLLGVRSDVERLLQAFDVLVFPSLFEGLPVSLIEAQAAGLPVLAANTISEEVDLGMGLVQFLQINDAILWADKVISEQKRITSDLCKKVLEEKGYDIRKTAQWLQQFYNASLY